jgi:hypothetical protein
VSRYRLTAQHPDGKRTLYLQSLDWHCKGDPCTWTDKPSESPPFSASDAARFHRERAAMPWHIRPQAVGVRA